MMRIMHKYMNKEADYDDYYDRYYPEFLRDAMNALNKLIEQEG